MTDKDDYKIKLKPLVFDQPYDGWADRETNSLNVPYGYRINEYESRGEDVYSVVIIYTPSHPSNYDNDEEFLTAHPTREEAEAAANKHFHDCITGWIKSIERKPTASGDSLKGGA